MRADRWLGRVAVVLVALEVAVVLGSWMVSVVWPGLHVRSLIAPDGLRWLIGRFAESLLSPLLVWLVVWAMAVGAWRGCGIADALRRLLRRETLGFRERTGLWAVGVGGALAVAALVLATCVPHALLRNALGQLWPSAASAGAVPLGAFLVTAGSLLYGALSGRVVTAQAAYRSLVGGIVGAAPLLPLYVLGAQLVAAVGYVAGWI